MAESQTHAQKTFVGNRDGVVALNSVDHTYPLLDGSADSAGTVNDQISRSLQKKPSVDMPGGQNQKPKKGSFQITRVINKAGMVDHHNEDGDSVGEDLDETNTEDMSSDILDVSKTTDIEPDPSSEDTVQSLSLATDDGKEAVNSVKPPNKNGSYSHNVQDMKASQSQKQQSNIVAGTLASQPAFQPGTIEAPPQTGINAQAQQNLPAIPNQINSHQNFHQILDAPSSVSNDNQESIQISQNTIPASLHKQNSLQRQSSASEDTQFGLRFQIVRVQNERYIRGRWTCYDFMDSEKNVREKVEEDLGSGNSSAASSVHYIPGVDDGTKNPFTSATTHSNEVNIPQSLSATTQLLSGDYVGQNFAGHVPSSQVLDSVPSQGLSNSATDANGQNSVSPSNQQGLPPHKQTQPTTMLSQQVPSGQASDFGKAQAQPNSIPQTSGASTGPDYGSAMSSQTQSVSSTENTQAGGGVDPNSSSRTMPEFITQPFPSATVPSSNPSSSSDTVVTMDSHGFQSMLAVLDPEGTGGLLKSTSPGPTPPLLEMMQYAASGAKEEEE